MKRNLRTAEERSSTARNDYYYGSIISKKLKRSTEVSSLEKGTLLNEEPMQGSSTDERAKENLLETKTHRRVRGHVEQNDTTAVVAANSSDENEARRPATVNENASTISPGHQCCPCIDLLIQKIDALIESRVNRKMHEMESKAVISVLDVLEEQQESQEMEDGTIDEHDEATVRAASAGSVEAIHSSDQSCSYGEHLVEFPMLEIWEAEDLNVKLLETTFYADMIIYLSGIGGIGPKATLNMFNSIFSMELQGKLNWQNEGPTIQSFPNILSVIHAAGRDNESYNEQTTNEMMKNALKNARGKKK